MPISRRGFIRVLVITAALVLLSLDPGIAVEKSFYHGKVIEMIVCTSVGGGYDTEARLIAPYLQKELPGSTVIVRNVPGGGHIVGANRVWEARPNGLTLAVANVPGLIAAQIRREPSIRFDLRKLTWIARLYTNHRFLLASKKTGFGSIQSFLKEGKEFKIGVAGVGSGPSNTGLLMAEALGLKKVRIINGYGGNTEYYGMLRDEIQGAIGSLEFWNELIEQGDVVPVLSFDAKRYWRYPNTPTLSELVKNETGRKIAAYISAESEVSRTIFAPPKVPDDIAKALSQATLKTLQSEAFKKIISQLKREAYDPLPGEELKKIVLNAMNVPPDIANLIIQVTKEQ